MRGDLLARLQLLGAALLFSTGGVAIKACQLGDWQIASFRCGVGALVLWLLLPAARRRWSPQVVAVALAYAATLLLYALANKATTAANAIFLQSSAPLYLLLAAPLVLGERIRRRDVAFALVMAGGLLLFFLGEQTASATAPAPLRGNLFAASAGVTWAATVLGLRWLASSADRPRRGEQSADLAVTAVFAGNVLGFLLPLPLALPVMEARAVDWLWLAFLGVFQVALAYVLMTRGLRGVPAFEASILLLVEPVLNPLWTWALHGEVPARAALLGGVLILGATTVKTGLDARRLARDAVAGPHLAEEPSA
ncbi:MAG: DMT family transporter [Acidobacteriota bacterium]